MNKSREERRRQKERINCIITTVCLILMLLMIAAAVLTQQTGAEQMPDPVEDYENEKIESALVESGYFRDDVPLDYETQAFLRSACDEFGVDFALMLALIEQETNFRNVSGDSGNSIGYCQIQPKWWSWLMSDIGATDLTNAEDNFRTACAILVYLGSKYDTLTDILTAYNTGHGGESKYADSVLSKMEDWNERKAQQI